MATAPRTKPVEDTITKVHDEVAVGEDLDFQRRWWRFERIVWAIFGIIIALDIAGVFGGGPLSHATVKSSDGLLNVKYERVERYSTPTIMTIDIAAAAIHNQQFQLWVSESAVKPLGNQRVIPQPQTSELIDHGILYTFPAGEGKPTTVQFALEPSGPGRFPLSIKLYDAGAPVQSSNVAMKILVMP